MQRLRDVIAECRVISLPGSTIRREHVTAVLGHQGIGFSFSEGVKAKRHFMGCSLAHRAALDAIDRLPALVLEDDVAPFTAEIGLPDIPQDADIVYLGVVPFGCLPDSEENIGRFGHRAASGLALASAAGADWLRLHSMTGAFAILYVSQRGLDAWRGAVAQALELRRPFDIMTAYAMNSVKVYTPREPLFYEAAHLQRPLKFFTPTQRLGFTANPLRALAEGHQRIAHLGQEAVRVRAMSNKDGLLEWRLSEAARS
ncbi:hypothetical protein [Paracoccus sp. SCSIO 75233]|uniref:hypothetical protein n=1 Tax=Paracoccus sp. SCSIO 75233 TaxID=3017782 RepID=UPI0022F096E1|nr:hypothetical protein [Paracoccus sp. SCSIO 75233]WBU54218.1 hypothetical protein PAF12_05135 [Paracoccus sp. SCSIO 75233]